MPVVRSLRRAGYNSTNPSAATHRAVLASVALTGFGHLLRAQERRVLWSQMHPAVPPVAQVVVAGWDPGQCYKATRVFPNKIVEIHAPTRFLTSSTWIMHV